MSKNGSQFIINLVKLPNGFAFQSFSQVDLAAIKKKSAAKDKPKNPANKTHRIFRELALDPPPKEDLLIPIPEESELAVRAVEADVEEEESVQIRREFEQFECPAKWYNDSSIHQIERQSLPQFFNERTSKTPGLYLKFRNFIVDLYRRNPTEYLTKIACRRILRGDVNTIMKIHTFLEKEGVINYCTSKQGNYSFSASILGKSLINEPISSLVIDKVPYRDEEVSSDGVDLTNITVTTINKCFSKSNRVFCHQCESICGIYWFKKKDETQKGNLLCPECFQLLKDTEAEDYIRSDIIKKIQAGSQDNKAFWSIQDNLKLLNFVSKPTQKWEDLENQFDKKKNFDDIILQFMQFPIANFEPDTEKPKETPIEDSPIDHANKLISRLPKKLLKNDNSTVDLNCPEFTKTMVAATKKLCEKMEDTIKKNLEIENNIEKSIFQIGNLKTLCKKTIQNQEMLIREGGEPNDEFDENSEFNENDQGEPDHQQDDQPALEQDHENQRENEDDGEIEDIMDNLDYS